MSKLSRKERKEEEKRIIAEMEAALREEKEQKPCVGGEDCVSNADAAQLKATQLKTAQSVQLETETETGQSDTAQETKKRDRASYCDVTPEKIHCKRCKTLMENGVCPTCGFRIYVPMEKGKRDKIRLVVTVVCMAVFLVLFLMSQMKNG